jgi:hypothetical protein
MLDKFKQRPCSIGGGNCEIETIVDHYRKDDKMVSISIIYECTKCGIVVRRRTVNATPQD